MTDAKEAAERIVAYWKERGITHAYQCSARNLDELHVATAYLSLLARPGEEEVKRMVARLSAMGLVVVPEWPTPEMIEVGIEARWQSAVRNPDSIGEIWTAMLTASKVQP